MKGKDLLTELLDLTRRQSAALAAEDLAEFDRLLERRQPLVAALEVAEWTYREEVERLARDLLACDERNRAELVRQLAAIGQELAVTRRIASALHGYKGPAEAGRPSSSLLDRLA